MPKNPNPVDHVSSSKVVPWMRFTLLAAAAYNILWGLWVIARPGDLFALAGIEPPRYPGIWQCVGMIVGVYGVGYAAAARDPIRHWPITLVGFLGKVFGPVGFFVPHLTGGPGSPGRLPLSWGLTIITNDLVWWIPFAAILYAAFKAFNAPAPSDQMSIADANRHFQTHKGTTISLLSAQHDVLVLFLRHSGCTFCRQTLKDLAEQLKELQRTGTVPVLVHMGDNDAEADFFARFGLGDVHRISDPKCQLYQAYELSRGTVGQLFGWPVWWRGFQAAILQRHGVGMLGGDGFQMGGVFLVRKEQVINAMRHKTVADRPNYCQIASP